MTSRDRRTARGVTLTRWLAAVATLLAGVLAVGSPVGADDDDDDGWSWWSSFRSSDSDDGRDADDDSGDDDDDGDDDDGDDRDGNGWNWSWWGWSSSSETRDDEGGHDAEVAEVAAPAPEPSPTSTETIEPEESHDEVALALGSMSSVVDQINARDAWEAGITGAGVNVAIVDTGVVPVGPLSEPDKVVAVVDLSLESDQPELRYLDSYGHGTHLAGIIAGRTPGAGTDTAMADPGAFLGVAPDAGIVSVKVADSSGAVDVSQVIAGVDWVTDHADELDIGVLNLSFSSASLLPYWSDPLNFAVERAWDAGIVVVVAAGNDGLGELRLSVPANDPYVIAVGGVEAIDGDRFAVPSWATNGNGLRNPDLAAPGSSIESLRAPGSRVDVDHPTGRLDDPQLFRGTGSSQAAAVVSGAAALLLDARPELTPDEVKAILRATANPDVIDGKWNEFFSGRGVVDVSAAIDAPVPAGAAQHHWRSSGDGSLEAARGGRHVLVDGVELSGEQTVLGASWAGTAWAGTRWSGGSWNGTSWTGGEWMGTSWSSAAWTGASWAGSSWSGSSWAGSSWSGAAWAGVSWS